jgi:hypothetical protein
MGSNNIFSSKLFGIIELRKDISRSQVLDLLARPNDGLKLNFLNQ